MELADGHIRTTPNQLASCGKWVLAGCMHRGLELRNGCGPLHLAPNTAREVTQIPAPSSSISVKSGTPSTSGDKCNDAT